MTTATRSDAAGSELARKMWRTLEPYHGIVYFTPHAAPTYAALGIEGSDGYFASAGRSHGRGQRRGRHRDVLQLPPARRPPSPSGRLGEGVTRRGAGGRAWPWPTPPCSEVLGSDLGGPAVTRAAALAQRAARAATLEGRPLFAGHAGLPWPDKPHLVLWHAITLLREYRGDGHVAALVEAGLDPVRGPHHPRGDGRRGHQRTGAAIIPGVARRRMGSGG